MSFIGSTTCFFGGGTAINPHYWAEKVESRDRVSDVRQFDPDLFRAQLINHNGSPPEEKERCRELDDNCFPFDEDMYTQYAAARELSWVDPSDIPDGMGFSLRFLWCCRAILLAIREWERLTK